MPVRVAPVRREAVAVEVEAAGTVRARVAVAVSSQVRGRVVELRVGNGSRVAAGELLVRLDDGEAAAQLARAEAVARAAAAARDEAARALAEAEAVEAETAAMLAETRAAEAAAQAALEDARAAVAAFEAALGKAWEGLRVQEGEVRQAEAALAAAEARSGLLEATYRRCRHLFEEHALTQQELDDVATRERLARAELQRTRIRVEGARAALARHRERLAAADAALRGHQERIAAADAALRETRSRIAQAERTHAAARVRIEAVRSRLRVADARFGEARAEVERLRARLESARILAPGAGVVVDTAVAVGQMVEPGRPLLRLEDPATYRLEAAIVATHAPRVQPGQPAEVRLDGLEAAALPSRVAEIVPGGDPASRTITVTLDLPPVPGLRSGLSGKARLALGRAEVLRIPARALVERGQLTMVFVVGADRRARLRLVTLGRRSGDLVEVLAGLAADERVVVEGAEALADGQGVEVRE